MACDIAKIQYDNVISALCTYQMQQALPFFGSNLLKIRIGFTGRNIVHPVQLLDHAVQPIQKRSLILSEIIRKCLFYMFFSGFVTNVLPTKFYSNHCTNFLKIKEIQKMIKRFSVYSPSHYHYAFTRPHYNNTHYKKGCCTQPPIQQSLLCSNSLKNF